MKLTIEIPTGFYCTGCILCNITNGGAGYMCGYYNIGLDIDEDTSERAPIRCAACKKNLFMGLGD